MPREIKDLKEFLSICSRKDTRHVKVKKNPDVTKFKVRCSKFLYTLVVNDKVKAEKIQKSIHPGVKQVLVTARKYGKKPSTKIDIPVNKMFRRNMIHRMKYADLELTTRGEFPHGMKEPGFVAKLDQNVPWYFSTYRSMYHWPKAGDQWSDLGEGEKHHDMHMYYTLAWWKMGEGIYDSSDSV